MSYKFPVISGVSVPEDKFSLEALIKALNCEHLSTIDNKDGDKNIDLNGELEIDRFILFVRTTKGNKVVSKEDGSVLFTNTKFGENLHDGILLLSKEVLLTIYDLEKVKLEEIGVNALPTPFGARKMSDTGRVEIVLQIVVNSDILKEYFLKDGYSYADIDVNRNKVDLLSDIYKQIRITED